MSPPVLYWDVLDSAVFFMDNNDMMPQFRVRTYSVVNVVCRT